MKLTDYLKDGKVTDEGLKKFEELLELEENLESSYGYLYSYSSLFGYNRTFYSKKDFRKKIKNEHLRKIKELEEKLGEYSRLRHALRRIRKYIFIRPALKGIIDGYC